MTTTIDVHDLPERQVYLVQEFVEFLRNKVKNTITSEEDNNCSVLSASNFAIDWDNEKDTIYDNWSKHYHVPER